MREGSTAIQSSVSSRRTFSGCWGSHRSGVAPQGEGATPDWARCTGMLSLEKPLNAATVSGEGEREKMEVCGGGGRARLCFAKKTRATKTIKIDDPTSARNNWPFCTSVDTADRPSIPSAARARVDRSEQQSSTRGQCEEDSPLPFTTSSASPSAGDSKALLTRSVAMPVRFALSSWGWESPTATSQAGLLPAGPVTARS